MIKLETFEACGRATPLNGVPEAEFEPMRAAFWRPGRPHGPRAARLINALYSYL
jgi:hypothetical protein